MGGSQKKINTGGIVAAVAVLLVLAIIGYRVWSDTSTGAESEDPPAMAAADEAAPSLEELEARATADRGDAQAWQELGFAYFERGRFANAAQAYEVAVEAAPDTAVLWSSLGEALVMASEDEPLPPAALDAFNRAAELDPGDERARYFLAVAKDLAGDHDGAIADWLALLADTPPGAPWEADLVRTIQQVGAINDIEVEDRIATAAGSRDILPSAAMAGIPGPSAQDMAAAARLSPDEQQDMAEQMVARLATRLESDASDIDGWVMLMRSYQTLERPGDARAALDRALAANPGAREELLSAAGTLGID